MDYHATQKQATTKAHLQNCRLARALAANLSGELYHPHENRTLGANEAETWDRVRIRIDEFLWLWLDFRPWKGPGLTISATLPPRLKHCHKYGAPSIGCNPTRGPEAICQDIRRRLMDDARKWTQEAHRDDHQKKTTQQTEDAWFSEMFALAGDDYAAAVGRYGERGRTNEINGQRIALERYATGPNKSDYRTTHRAKIELHSEHALRAVLKIVNEDWTLAKSQSAP